jgi:AcrR family transcriptional regulator
MGVIDEHVEGCAMTRRAGRNQRNDADNQAFRSSTVPRSRSAPRGAARADAPRSRAARPYGGRSAKERMAERRTRLLDAGLALFGTRGYANTSIETICSKAGVTARHFYEQFESRELLLLDVYERVIDHARHAVLTALEAPHAEPRSRVIAGIEAYVHAVLDDPRHARIACVEVVGAGQKVERRRRKAIHEIAKVIDAQAQALAEQGNVERRDFSLTAIAMAGACNELVTDAIMRPTPPPISALVDALVRLFLAVIAQASAALPPPKRGKRAKR